MNDKVWSSEDLARLDIEQFERITEPGEFRYELTSDELGWLDWIAGRYAIAVLIRDNLDFNTGIVWLDTHEVGQALADEGLDRPPCLAEDTQLCRLIWFIGPNE